MSDSVAEFRLLIWEGTILNTHTNFKRSIPKEDKNDKDFKYLNIF